MRVKSGGSRAYHDCRLQLVPVAVVGEDVEVASGDAWLGLGLGSGLGLGLGLGSRVWARCASRPPLQR